MSKQVKERLPLKKEVLIEIKGIQKIDGEKDSSELFTVGTFYRKNDSYYLVYEETESTGYEGCSTTLKVEGNEKVSLLRHGPVRSNLVIEQDHRNVGVYHTPEGELMIGVSAAEIDSQLNDDGGKLFFKYALDINSSHVSDNEVYVSVRETTTTS